VRQECYTAVVSAAFCGDLPDELDLPMVWRS
jgi:hypothetical protein